MLAPRKKGKNGVSATRKKKIMRYNIGQEEHEEEQKKGDVVHEKEEKGPWAKKGGTPGRIKRCRF